MKLFGKLLDITVERIFIGRLTIHVLTDLDIIGKDMTKLTIVMEILLVRSENPVTSDTIITLFRLTEHPIQMRILSNMLAVALLDNNQVRTCLGASLAAEHSVRQTDGTDDMTDLGETVTDKAVTRTVKNTPAGNERNQTTVMNGVKGFQEEIVMQGVCGPLLIPIIAVGIIGVEDLDIPEGYITGSQVKSPQDLLRNGLEAIDNNLVFGMQCFQDLAG